MTTVVLLLGLVDRDAPFPAGAPCHRRVSCGDGLDAIVIDQEPPRGEAPECEALALATVQAAVLSAYAVRDDVLPVALGAAFSGDDALAAHLSANAWRLDADREALAGAAEYVVAMDAGDAAPAAPDIGVSGYLRRKQAERGRGRDLDAARRSFAARVLTALDAAGASLAPPRRSQGTTLFTVSALLQRERAAEATRALAALAPEAGQLGLELRMIGPCAPFSFVAREPTHV